VAESKIDARVKSVETLVAEKLAVTAKEKGLIDALNAVLSKMGYRVTPRPHSRGTRMSIAWASMPHLLADLDALYLEHRPCGELEAEISGDEAACIVMAFSCGAQLARRIEGAESLDR
jgi:hypothetical protein